MTTAKTKVRSVPTVTVKRKTRANIKTKITTRSRAKAAANDAATIRAENRRTCTGTLASPGLLAGHYRGTVIVKGYCIVDGGPTQIDGNLVLRSGFAVNATYARNDVSGSGRSRLWVKGDVKVYKGATLLMGCEPRYAPCTDDPDAAAGGELRVRDIVGGSLLASWARGVNVYDSRIKGNRSTGARRGRLVLRRPHCRCLLVDPRPPVQRL